MPRLFVYIVVALFCGCAIFSTNNSSHLSEFLEEQYDAETGRIISKTRMINKIKVPPGGKDLSNLVAEYNVDSTTISEGFSIYVGSGTNYSSTRTAQMLEHIGPPMANAIADGIISSINLFNQ